MAKATYALADPFGVKVGLHRSGVRVHPDEEGDPDEEVVSLAREWALRTFGIEARPPAAVRTSLYTNAPDRETFYLERHGRLVIGSPCSCHGFKFAPALGSRLAARLPGARLTTRCAPGS